MDSDKRGTHKEKKMQSKSRETRRRNRCETNNFKKEENDAKERKKEQKKNKNKKTQQEQEKTRTLNGENESFTNNTILQYKFNQAYVLNDVISNKEINAVANHWIITRTETGS